MLIGLKNARATYQITAITPLHDTMHNKLDVYMNDMIVKVRDTYLAHYGAMFEIVQGNEYIPVQGLHHKDTTTVAKSKGNHHL